jgi:hypothetical protein
MSIVGLRLECGCFDGIRKDLHNPSAGSTCSLGKWAKGAYALQDHSAAAKAAHRVGQDYSWRRIGKSAPKRMCDVHRLQSEGYVDTIGLVCRLPVQHKSYTRGKLAVREVPLSYKVRRRSSCNRYITGWDCARCSAG